MSHRHSEGAFALRRIAFTVTVSLAVALLSPVVAAESGRPDYDIDNDNLIEINDLQDLDQIRYYLDGSGIYGEAPSVLGCPDGCEGFELNANLDFDTNGNGELDAGDQFYGDGQGWLPIGAENGPTLPEAYTGRFDGSSYVISNMTCVSANEEGCGLFDEVRDTTLSNVHMTNAYVWAVSYNGVIAARLTDSTLERSYSTGYIGPAAGFATGGLVAVATNSVIDECYSLVDLAGGEVNGGLVGYAVDSSIQRSFSTGRITSSRHHAKTGGIVGMLSGSTVDNCFATGNIGLSPESGGLVGTADAASTISRSLSTGHLIGTGGPLGGLLGSGDASVVESYWATDLSGQTTSAGVGGQGLLGSQLRCFQVPWDWRCGVNNVFQSWGWQVNSANNPLWSFGSNQELPGLNIQGMIFRDADGDGTLDSEDDYRLNYAAATDSDGDWSIDRWKEGCEEACRANSGLVLDQFPNNVAATLDLDLDGMPESWNPFCFGLCQSNSGLTIDPYPMDADNDQSPDDVDEDDDGNGIDDIDTNSNGLVDIENWFELDLVRNQMRGYGQRHQPLGNQLPDGTFEDDSDTSGCPPRLLDGVLVRACQGYELMNDLDFDTNGNGQIDVGDEFYDEGYGWTTIGHDSDIAQSSFQTRFNGNGHVIKNLYLNRFNGDQEGLFGATRDAVIENLGLVGPLMHIFAGSDVGAIVGRAARTKVTDVYSTGLVQAHGSGAAGGLIGYAMDSHLEGTFNTGDVDLLSQCDSLCAAGGLVGKAVGGSIIASFVTGNTAGNWTNTAGLVGLVEAGDWGLPPTSIEACFSAGFVGGNTPIGGFVATMPNDVVSSYWAVVRSSQPASAGNATPASFSQLTCPVSANNTSCASVPLYTGWQAYVNDDGADYWDFGDSSELPGLCIDGTLYRDAEGDRVLDPLTTCDVTPNSPCSGVCANPTNVSWSGNYSNNSLGIGETCIETTQAVLGGNCGEFAAGRQLTVNGVPMTCNGQNWTAVPAAVNGGHCIQVSAGNNAWAFLTLW